MFVSFLGSSGLETQLFLMEITLAVCQDGNVSTVLAGFLSESFTFHRQAEGREAAGQMGKPLLTLAGFSSLLAAALPRGLQPLAPHLIREVPGCYTDFGSGGCKASCKELGKDYLHGVENPVW